MIQEISAEEFEKNTVDSKQFKYQGVKYGFVIFKSLKDELYYVHSPTIDLKIASARSFEEFLKSHDQFVGKPRQFDAKSIFWGLNTDGRLFPDSTQQRIDDLGKLLKIGPLNKENCNVNTLKEVDSILNKQADPADFKRNNFLNLVALLGEVIINEHGNQVEWTITLSDDKVTWDPDILYGKEQLYIGSKLLDDIEDNDNEPLADTFEVVEYVIHNLKKSE